MEIQEKIIRQAIDKIQKQIDKINTILNARPAEELQQIREEMIDLFGVDGTKKEHVEFVIEGLRDSEVQKKHQILIERRANALKILEKQQKNFMKFLDKKNKLSWDLMKLNESLAKIKLKNI